MPINPNLVRDHFLAAAELPAAERAAYLTTHCGGDAELRAAVERLLAAHDQPASILNRPTPAGLEQTATFVPSEQPGTVVAGRYKLLEAIGEGGMGTVWVAEQTQPVRRKVALKLIKPGMDSKSVLARFEAERQALAVMDHPNIAKVLDGGLTDTGRPFFVMEYVKGVPITEYCDATRLSVPERLQLFVEVCQAVQHAHQKGIIHRDLKPSNILVAPYDGRPVPKVIDFGLAKAMHQSLTERTLHTDHETVLGTPLYMSPEQAHLNNLDIDTRSDLYSLGVLLYELLTGTTPLEKRRLKQAAWEEVRRIIREEEPPRPSTRLTSSQALPSLAAGRQIEPARLTKLVRGELDWIVMKALEKDRNRRYETANGFALDVQRYLAGEPVLAAPPSARYRLRKFARKHRAALTTAVAMILLLLAGAAISTWQAVRALRAEAAARAAEQDAEARRAEAERQTSRAEAGEKLASERLVQVDAEKKKAEEEKQIAQSVRDFLQNKLLAQADAWIQAGAPPQTGGLSPEAKANPTIRELLDRAAKELVPEKIDANFPNQPLLQAAILETVGQTYRNVGECERAIGFLQRSVALYRQHVGPDHADTLRSMILLSQVYQTAEKLDLALPLCEETLALTKKIFGPEHPLTLTSMDTLAGVYQETRKLDLALPLSEKTLELTKKIFGPEHPTTLVSMNNLAGLYLESGKPDLALPLFEKTLELRKTISGPNHPDTITTMCNLASAYKIAGKLDRALPLYKKTLEIEERVFGPEHPMTLTCMFNLAGAYQDAGNLDMALPLFEQCYQAGKKYAELQMVGTSLLDGYVQARKPEQAAALAKELLADARTQLPKESPQLAGQLARIALSLLQAKAFTEAELLLRECLAIREKTQPDEWTTFTTISMLGGALSGQKKYAEAEPLLLAGYKGMKQREAKIPLPGKVRLTEALERLVQVYEALEKNADAAKWRRELEAAQAKLPAHP